MLFLVLFIWGEGYLFSLSGWWVLAVLFLNYVYKVMWKGVAGRRSCLLVLFCFTRCQKQWYSPQPHAPAFLHAQGVWHSCSPWDNEVETFFLKNSPSLSRGFLIQEEKTFAFLDSECPRKGFLSPWLTSTVRKNASNQTKSSFRQNPTGSIAMVGTTTK